jgi:hypothetical protein
MSNKTIIDLCGGTGSWSKYYKNAGYNVVVITLPEYNVSDWWIVGGVLRFRKNKWAKDGMDFLDIAIKDIYGILAAPPCTMFSIARTTAKTPRDLIGGMQTVKSCIAIIQGVQEKGHILKFWALENPRGLLRRFLGKPAFTFKHWQFDSTIRHKPTDVWGNFNYPKPTHKKMTGTKEDRESTWGSPQKPKEYEGLKLDRGAIRAITPDGFAQAFYQSNK